MILLISLGLDPSLITKVSLHTFPPPDPPFSPPQTFAQLIAMEKGKTFREDTCFFIFIPGSGELCFIHNLLILLLNL